MSSMSSTIAGDGNNRTGLASWVIRHQLVAAYAIVFALAWGITFFVLIGLRGKLANPLQLVFSLIVGWSPAIAVVAVSAISGGRPAVRDLLRRFLIFRVGVQWYLVGLFLMAAVILGGIGLHVLFGGEMPPIPAAASTKVSMVVVTFVVMVVAGAVFNTEEILWRGFALPRLQSRYGFLAACLLLAVPEILLHLPNFFDPDAVFYRSVGIFWFSVFSVAAVILYAWIFNRTQGSLIFVTLLHTSQNAWSNLLSDNSLRPFQFTVALMVLAALVIVIAERARGTRPDPGSLPQPVPPVQ